MTPWTSLLPAVFASNAPVAVRMACAALLLGVATVLLVFARRLKPQTRHRAVVVMGGLASLFTSVVLVVATLRIDSERKRIDREASARADADRVTSIYVYLSKACRREQRLTIARPVRPGSGVLIDVRSARAVPGPGEPVQLSWLAQLPVGRMLMASAFAFVEQDLRNTTRGAISVTARKSWWIPRLHSLVPPAARDALESRLEMVETDVIIEGPVSRSLARYALSVDDVSMPEDRLHGVARLHLRLVERGSRALVMEYVGFVAPPRSRYFDVQLACQPPPIAWINPIAATCWST